MDKATSGFLDFHPDTILTIHDTAPLIGKTASTLSVDVTRRPENIPAITRLNGRIFFRVGDILEYLQSGRIPRPEPFRKRALKGLNKKTEATAT